MHSPFGVEHAPIAKTEQKVRYVRRSRKEGAAGGAAVGAAGGAALGAAVAPTTRLTGTMADLRHQDNEAKVQRSAPTARKQAKAQNLADRAATPGEKQAAQAAADRLRDKAKQEHKTARKQIPGYTRTKYAAKLKGKNAALGASLAAGAVGMGALGAAAGSHAPGVKAVKVSKADAAQRWRARERRANRVENTGQAVAGGAGALLGGAALRDAAFKDYPHLRAKAVRRASGLSGKTVRALGATAIAGKPGLKTLGAAAAGTVVAATGTRSKNIARRRADRLEDRAEIRRQLAKGFDEPGSLMHRADLAKAANMSNRELATRKKVQGATTIAGSTLGLAAIGSLGGAKLLPKATKLGKTPRGQAYARHLDRTATNLSIGAGGIGGVGGYNFAAIQRAEAKKVAKAYDPERSRKRRLRAYELGSAGATAGAAGAAAVNEVRRAGAKRTRGGYEAKASESVARATRAAEHSAHYEARAAKARQQKKATAPHRADAKFYRGQAVHEATQAVNWKDRARAVKVPSGATSAKLAAGAAAGAAVTAGIRRHRKRGGQSYGPRAWGANPAPKRNGGHTPSTTRAQENQSAADIDRLIPGTRKPS